jgi:hypothetical protein
MYFFGFKGAEEGEIDLKSMILFIFVMIDEIDTGYF